MSGTKLDLKTSESQREQEKKNEQILRGIVDFSRNMDWISENQEKLRKKYPNKYIAVVNLKVIDSDSDLQILIRKLKEKGKSPSEIPIEFIAEKPTRLIL